MPLRSKQMISLAVTCLLLHSAASAASEQCMMNHDKTFTCPSTYGKLKNLVVRTLENHEQWFRLFCRRGLFACV